MKAVISGQWPVASKTLEDQVSDEIAEGNHWPLITDHWPLVRLLRFRNPLINRLASRQNLHCWYASG